MDLEGPLDQTDAGFDAIPPEHAEETEVRPDLGVECEIVIGRFRESFLQEQLLSVEVESRD